MFELWLAREYALSLMGKSNLACKVSKTCRLIACAKCFIVGVRKVLISKVIKLLQRYA